MDEDAIAATERKLSSMRNKRGGGGLQDVDDDKNEHIYAQFIWEGQVKDALLVGGSTIRAASTEASTSAPSPPLTAPAPSISNTSGYQATESEILLRERRAAQIAADVVRGMHGPWQILSVHNTHTTDGLLLQRQTVFG